MLKIERWGTRKSLKGLSTIKLNYKQKMIIYIYEPKS